MKEKIKTTSFWLGLSGAVVIVLDCISEIFNLNICSSEVENIIISICSVLIMLGVVTKKNVQDVEGVEKEDLLLELRADDGEDETIE